WPICCQDHSLGLGTAALTSPSTDPLADTVVRRALAAGIGVVDNAPMYGCGDTEVALGAALPTDASITLSTKVGRVIRLFASGKHPQTCLTFTRCHSRRTHFDWRHTRRGGSRRRQVSTPDRRRYPRDRTRWRNGVESRRYRGS